MKKFYTWKILKCGYLTFGRWFAHLSRDATPENAFFLLGSERNVP